MQWKLNELTTQDDINKVNDLIDNKLLIERICFSLNINEQELFYRITEDELNLLTATILINRGIDNKELINSLFNNIESSILDPYKLVNAKKAADLISSYCNNPLSYIYIFADYDCDGINSGYIMTDILSRLSKGKVIVKYPNRIEGYGLNIDWCKEIINNHTSFEDLKLNNNVLVITVDNGITKYKEVELLQEAGIECIITDHHESKEGEVPNCIVVNPHNKDIKQDNTYHHLCGAGVAFKVCELVQHNFNKYNMLKYTPNVAIATLSDVMTLNSENLALVQYGLEIMNGDNCPKGIKELMKVKKIDVLTANDILWTVAPIINACGRMGNTELASRLFFDNFNPVDIVKQMDKINENRKKLTKKAKEDIDKMNFDNDKVCIEVTDKYPTGIVGIIAGKIAEAFNKPSIVVSKNKSGLYHGSIRSVNNIDMFNHLVKLKELNLIEEYGGHAAACVCGFNLDKLDEIKNYFNENIKIEIIDKNNVVEEILNIDETITFNHLNKVVYSVVNMLPCDNRKYKNPTFALTDVKIKSFKEFKSGYTELILQQGNDLIEASVYGDVAIKLFKDILPNIEHKVDSIHIAGCIDKQSFFSSKFSKKVYTLKIIDIKIA